MDDNAFMPDTPSYISRTNTQIYFLLHRFPSPQHSPEMISPSVPVPLNPNMVPPALPIMVPIMVPHELPSSSPGLYINRGPADGKMHAAPSGYMHGSGNAVGNGAQGKRQERQPVAGFLFENLGQARAQFPGLIPVLLDPLMVASDSGELPAQPQRFSGGDNLREGGGAKSRAVERMPFRGEGQGGEDKSAADLALLRSRQAELRSRQAAKASRRTELRHGISASSSSSVFGSSRTPALDTSAPPSRAASRIQGPEARQNGEPGAQV